MLCARSDVCTYVQCIFFFAASLTKKMCYKFNDATLRCTPTNIFSLARFSLSINFPVVVLQMINKEPTTSSHMNEKKNIAIIITNYRLYLKSISAVDIFFSPTFRIHNTMFTLVKHKHSLINRQRTVVLLLLLRLVVQLLRQSNNKSKSKSLVNFWHFA